MCVIIYTYVCIMTHICVVQRHMFVAYVCTKETYYCRTFRICLSQNVTHVCHRIFGQASENVDMLDAYV